MDCGDEFFVVISLSIFSSNFVCVEVGKGGVRKRVGDLPKTAVPRSSSISSVDQNMGVSNVWGSVASITYSQKFWNEKGHRRGHTHILIPPGFFAPCLFPHHAKYKTDPSFMQFIVPPHFFP